MNRWLRAFVIVSVLAAVGTVVTVLLYIDTTNGETSLAHESFKGEFSSLLSEFKGFMAGQLRGLSAISDAVSSHGSLPTASVFQRVGFSFSTCYGCWIYDAFVSNLSSIVLTHSTVPFGFLVCVLGTFPFTSCGLSPQIGRTYEGIFQSAFGGIGILARVNNTKAAKDAWAAATSLRYNRTVTPIILPPYADADDPFVYMIQDDLPNIPSVTAYQGLEITVLDHVRQPIWSMINHTSSSANTSVLVELFSKLVGFSGLIEFTRVLDVSQWGFLSFTTVFDDDPTAYLVMTATLFDNFVADFKRRSPQAVLTITDANGFPFHSGTCTLKDAKQILELAVPLTSAATWRIQVGQCPEYEARFITWKRYIILAICIVVTLLAVMVSAVVLLYQERLVQDAIERTRHEEKATAHQIIVGYICHELRNPLHIIKTSFTGMQASLRKLSGNQFLRAPNGIGSNDATFSDADDVDLLEEAPSEEELQSIVMDAQSALHQMLATVNEVLDYRAIDTGLSSLKLNVEPMIVSEVRGIIVRCPKPGCDFVVP
jgi:signal transduction histidine kinase